MEKPDHQLLREKLKQLVEDQGVALRSVPLDGDQLITLSNLLEEVIAVRQEGYPQLSLRMIEAARSVGFDSPWLQDNEARALACVGQEDDAVATWSQLLQDQNPAIVDVARDMLAVYEPRVRQAKLRANILEQSDEFLAQNDFQAALSLLAESMLSDPDFPGYRHHLIDALSRRQASSHSSEVRSQDVFRMASTGPSECEGIHHQALAQLLLLLLQEHGWMPKCLHGDVQDAATLERHCLIEADQLRREGRPELSGMLLLEANRFGLRSPASAHGFAEACLASGDLEQAREIWRQLAEQPDADVAAQATERLDALAFSTEIHPPGERQTSQPEQPAEAQGEEPEPEAMEPAAGNELEAGTEVETEEEEPEDAVSSQDSLATERAFSEKKPDHRLLRAKLKQVINAYGVTLRFVPLKDDQEISLKNLLEEVIAVRQEGHPQLSIRMIEAARSAGFDSPWLQENEARALACSDQAEEAVAIWSQLLQDQNPAIVNMAREMLAVYEPRVKQARLRVKVLGEVDTLLAENNFDAARSLLATNMLLDPDCLDYRERLDAAISFENPTESSQQPHEDMIRRRKLWLQRQEILLQAAEQKIDAAGLLAGE